MTIPDEFSQSTSVPSRTLAAVKENGTGAVDAAIALRNEIQMQIGESVRSLGEDCDCGFKRALASLRE